jgi:hypothetical protein
MVRVALPPEDCFLGSKCSCVSGRRSARLRSAIASSRAFLLQASSLIKVSNPTHVELESPSQCAAKHQRRSRVFPVILTSFTILGHAWARSRSPQYFPCFAVALISFAFSN